MTHEDSAFAANRFRIYILNLLARVFGFGLCSDYVCSRAYKSLPIALKKKRPSTFLAY